MHLIDIVLVLVLAAAVFAAIRTFRKKGGCSCGGNCEGCAAAQNGISCSGCNKYNTTIK